MAIDDVSIEDLVIEFRADDGQGGEKTVKMSWSEFINSQEVPKEYRMMILEEKGDKLKKMEGRLNADNRG
jgi:hypothetical protein